jgi:hypothetical protein
LVQAALQLNELHHGSAAPQNKNHL